MPSRRGYLLVAVCAFTLAITLLIIAATAHAAPAAATAAKPAALCTTYTWTCTQYRSVFGVRYCVAYLFRCAKYAHAGKIAGLAAPVAGNRGGCGRNNMTTVTCNVSDAGSGFVSGNCEFGYWFSRVSTARTFRTGQVITARGCEGLNGELYAPIRISR